MGQLRISVAMCTYNGARHLSEQLESIRLQTLPPDEVVVCDDSSTDETLQILRDFATKAAFSVRIFSNPSRLGSTKNFDKAISLCKSDIVVLADQDDVWKETKVERLESVFLAEPDVDYVFSDGEVIDEHGRRVGCSMWQSLGFEPSSLPDRFKEDEVLFLLKQNVVTGAATAFRSSLAEVVQPIPPAWLHDHWIALLGSVFGRGVALSDRLIMYRQHPNQQKGVRRSTLSEKCRESMISNQTALTQRFERLKELDARASRFLTSTNHRGQGVGTIREKMSHVSMRSAARSTSGLSKVRAVMSEVFAGRYHRFSDSWLSIARDLLA
jgi:glycosyltransferase involved in cell wall biosynthesis